MTQDPAHISRDDLHATWETYNEVDNATKPAVVDSLVEQVERVIDQRVSQQVAVRNTPAPPQSNRQFVLALASLGIGIPLSGIGAGTSGVIGLIIVWIGIVMVNLAYAWSQRRP